MEWEYSKVSIIRPGRSRLLGFEKKDSTGRLHNRDFFQISRPGCLIETKIGSDSHEIKQYDNFFLIWT